MKYKAVILSPNLSSLYSLCVTQEALNHGMSVEGIVCVRILNLQRILKESRRDGLTHILKKLWKKALLKDRDFRRRDFETLNDRKHKLGMTHSSLKTWARDHKVPFLSCGSLNDLEVLNALRQWRPQVTLFTGGGLVRKPLMDASGFGVLNCHAGILPQYRGMNVVEWPVIENRFDLIGITTHLMDEGIDTGPILRTKRIPFRPGESCAEIRERFPAMMVDHLVGSALDLLSGKIQAQPQRAEDGKQYFVMHPQILELAEERAKNCP